MFPLDTTTRAGRMLEAGRITVTFRSTATGEHITLTAKARGKKEGSEKWVSVPLADALVVFIEVPNQEGWNDKVGKVTRRGGFVPDGSADPARVYCAHKLLDFVAGEAMPAGLEVFEESRCGVCGRALTDPVSIERGIGPECYGRQTGSKHETKGSPSAGLPGRDPRVPADDGVQVASPVAGGTAYAGKLNRPYEDGPADMPRVTSRPSSRGRSVPPGTWRQRKAFVQEELQLERENGKRGYRKQLKDRPVGASSQNAMTATGSAIPY